MEQADWNSVEFWKLFFNYDRLYIGGNAKNSILKLDDNMILVSNKRQY